jgi:hypothetical protein
MEYRGNGKGKDDGIIVPQRNLVEQIYAAVTLKLSWFFSVSPGEFREFASKRPWLPPSRFYLLIIHGHLPISNDAA